MFLLRIITLFENDQMVPSTTPQIRFMFHKRSVPYLFTINSTAQKIDFHLFGLKIYCSDFVYKDRV
jgi:hypothetical protein